MSTEDIQSETAEATDKPRRVSKQKVQTNVESDKEEVRSPVQLNLFLLHEKETYGDAIPKFQTELSACFDLAAYLQTGNSVKYVDIYGQILTRKVPDTGLPIHPGERFLIPTGIIFDIPAGYGMEIYPRSGQSFKKGMSLSNCTANIDADYVEETFVSLTNIGKQSFTIVHNERIAQAKLVKLVDTEINLVSERPKQKTSRNGGFGSTGK